MITAGLALAPVTTIGGIRIQPDVMLEDLSPFKSGMLILPGGENWEYGANSAAIAMARRFIAHCVPVAAICEATWALARAGLLDNRYHTSNAPDIWPQAATEAGDSIATSRRSRIRESLRHREQRRWILREIFEALNLYRADMLDAWYGLFRHGDTSMFYESARSA